MVKCIILSIFSKKWIFDKQTYQDISFQNLFELSGISIFSFFQKRLSQIQRTIFIITSNIHNFSNGQFEYGDMSFAHVCLCLESGYFELNLVDLLTDIFTCKFAVLDLQTVQLEQDISREGLLFIVTDQLEQILALSFVLVLNCLLKEQEVRFHSDWPVEYRDEFQDILLYFGIVSRAEDRND